MKWVWVIIVVVVGLLFLAFLPYLLVHRHSQKMKKAGKQDATTLTHESYLYAVKGDYWKSIELAEKALELDPKMGEAWRMIGNSYELIGDDCELKGDKLSALEYHKKATESWNKAKEVQPNIIIPSYHK